MTRLVPVLTAAQAAATDAATIRAGTPSLSLMERAATAAVEVIRERYGAMLADGVRIYTGPGNNGGDGWAIARLLAQDGVPVAVEEVAGAKTPDARTMRERAAGSLASDPISTARVLIDAMLGTGSTGEPRGAIADAVHALRAARSAGATVVAIDVPTGLDATTGESALVAPANCTITFGSAKRGQLMARDIVGELVVVDIGLGEPTGEGTIAELVTSEWVRSTVPPIVSDAHKGTRRKLVIVGGAEGMAGAVILAARSALRSGIGMVKAVVHRASLPAVQAAVPAALAAPWPASADEAGDLVNWADGLLLGPGLGASDASRALADTVLGASEKPVVVDADGLNVYRGDASSLGNRLQGRPALLTPHPMEASRLSDVPVEKIVATRFECAGDLASRTGAGVLLKGVPTVIAGVDGRTFVSARGTAALATAGSGDVLAGIAATLLVQIGDALQAGACAAFVHGRAAEVVDPAGVARGVDLDDVLTALGKTWRVWPPAPRPPILAELPALGAFA